MDNKNNNELIKPVKVYAAYGLLGYSYEEFCEIVKRLLESTEDDLNG